MPPSQPPTRPAATPAIDFSQSEVDYWTRFFECSELQLRNAAAAVGLSVDEVWHYLARQKQFPHL